MERHTYTVRVKLDEEALARVLRAAAERHLAVRSYVARRSENDAELLVSLTVEDRNDAESMVSPIEGQFRALAAVRESA